MKTTTAVRSALLASAIALLATSADAQITTGTIYGSGYGLSPGQRDSNWRIVAVPSSFAPPGGQTVPYDSYVPYSVPSSSFIGYGTPQAGVTGTIGGVPVTNYWITPTPTTGQIAAPVYKWIAQQTFTVPQTGVYRFDFPAAGDNYVEFFLDGAINTSNPEQPTISGGQQIGGLAGGFGAMTTFTGGAELTAGTHTASMILWDYGGETAAIIGSSTFAPTVGYWAPSSGAGGNGTWNNSNSFWSPSADGSGTKLPWTSGVGVAYFGGTSGTVSVGENVNVSQIYFNTGGYNIQGAGGELVWGNGATITARSGTNTISATQTAGSGLKIGAGIGTVVLQGTTNLGWAQQLLVDGGNLVINGVVNSPITNGSVYVGIGSLDGTGTINGTLAGLGKINPGPSGTASGILTTTQLNPTDGLDLRFVFSGTTPNYADATNSVNDVLRITGGAPFSASNTSSNTIEIFFPNITNASQIAVGAKFLGGFFTDADASFLSSISSSTFTFYAYGDGNGPFSYKGLNYYALNDVAPGFLSTYTVSVGVEPTTANFAGGSSLGQVSTFTVIVPEPTTTAMALAGIAYAACEIRRRRRSRPGGMSAG